MTESEKREKALAIMNSLQSQPRAASIFTASQAASQAVVEHVLSVQQTCTAMSKNGLTVDDLIAAYNRGSGQAFDYAVSFFFSAYAIALHENKRDVLDAIDRFQMPKKSNSFPFSGSQIDKMTEKGITQRDLEKMERLGEKNTRRDMGIDALIKLLNKVEGADLADRVAEIIDEEITAADIMERCRKETGIRIQDVLGIEG